MLAHPYLIAQKIEIYTFLPSAAQQLQPQIPLNKIDFKRLGFVSFGDNAKSGLRARELKRVDTTRGSPGGVRTLLVKLILYEPHANELNPYR